MKRAIVLGVLIAGGVLSLAVAGMQQQPPASEPVISPGPSAARFPKNADEFDQLFNEVKNWGRWGTDDQLGSANLVTEAKRK